MEVEDVSVLLMSNLFKVKNWNKKAITEPAKEKYNKILVSSDGTLNKFRIKDIEMNAMKLETTSPLLIIGKRRLPCLKSKTWLQTDEKAIDKVKEMGRKNIKIKNTSIS